MADPPQAPQSTTRNPNWGGRREGSGRKKHTPMTALPKALDTTRTYSCKSPFFVSSLSTSTDTTQTQHLPVNTSAPARGFFAPRNRLQDSSTTILSNTVSTSNGTVRTDREQGTNQANGA
jgi:hypothetical protein